MKEPLHPIGYTRKPFGLKGELKIQIEEIFIEDLLQTKVCFLPFKGHPTPYFIEHLRETDSLLIKFEDIDNKENARQLANLEILLRKSDLSIDPDQPLIDEDLEYGAFVGYTLIDVQLGEIGSIEEIQEYPQQEMAAVTYNDHPFLIPLNEHFIQSIDEVKQLIYVELPEGLLSI